jgi:hypothetical protein
MFKDFIKHYKAKWNEEPKTLFYSLPVNYQRTFLFGSNEDVQKAIEDLQTRERLTGQNILTEEVLDDIEQFRHFNPPKK